MNAQQKIVAYREALAKFSADRAEGHHLEEPKPETFGLRTTAEVFVAKRVREDHFKK